MATADWSHLDPSVPSIVASSDLFDGELFGDELIDIYNSTSVEVRCSPDDGNEIPTLLPPASDLDGLGHKQNDHIGTHVAIAAAAIDDGFGAFRPSTSFSDLTSLLESPPATKAVPEAQPMVIAAPITSSAVTTVPTTSPNASKKRTAVASDTAPAPKRRGGCRARSTSGGKRSSVAKTTNVAVVPLPIAAVAEQTVGPPNQITTATGPSTAPSGDRRKPANVGSSPPNPLSAVLAKSSTPSALTVKLTAVKPCAPVLSSSSVVVTPRVSPPPMKPCIVLANTDSDARAAAVATAAAAAAVANSVAGNTSPPSNGDDDFKTVAQAAVSSLILSAAKSDDSVGHDGGSVSSESSKIDTSTAHIQALTGSNWVAACGGGGSAGSGSAVDACDDSKSQNRARRQNLTPDERARQNRDRNREHARNTRLRKKAYVEELKRTLTEMVAQRDASELEKKQATQREVEQREVRFRVMEEFLKLRGRNEASVTRWAAILEEGFVLTLPVTEFRKMVTEELGGSATLEQQLQGVAEVMSDSVHVASFLRSLREELMEDGGTPPSVTLSYHCDRKDFFMDGCNAVLDWTATTVGANLAGANNGELSFKGTMRANFSPASNKLRNAKIAFDTGAVVSQLQPFSRVSLGFGPPDDCIVDHEAFQAESLLDSLQVPQLTNSVPCAITVVPNSSSSSSETSSSDESEVEHADAHESA